MPDTDQKPKHKPVFNRDLANALNFTADDLAANREGELTVAQYRAASGKLDRWVIIMVVCLAAALGVALLGKVVILPTAQEVFTNEDTARAVTGFFLITGVFPLGSLVFYAFRSEKLIWDLKKQVVDSKSGQVGLVTPPGRSGMGKLTIEDESFQLDGQAYLRFRDLGYYTIYYLPYSRMILSAEPMED